MLHTVNIADSLFTKTKQKVLGLLFREPENSFYLNEIVRDVGMGKGTVKRELEKMTQSGLLTIKRIGNQNHYQANPLSPIFNELLSITRKTFGISDIIEQALQPSIKVINFAFIYGSVAKGRDTSKSDIDLMIVSEYLGYSEVMNLLIPVEAELKRPINPSIYTLLEFNKRLEEKNSFISRVLEQDRINIIGDVNVVRKAG